MEDLLKPRVKCIAAYPGMDCNVGDIFELPSEHWRYADKGYCDLDFFSAWPAIFQPLPWYSERDVSEMPGYVIGGNGVIIAIEVSKWARDNHNFYSTEGRCFSTVYFTPSTLEQYTAYQQIKNQTT